MTRAPVAADGSAATRRGVTEVRKIVTTIGTGAASPTEEAVLVTTLSAVICTARAAERRGEATGAGTAMVVDAGAEAADRRRPVPAAAMARHTARNLRCPRRPPPPPPQRVTTRARRRTRMADGLLPTPADRQIAPSPFRRAAAVTRRSRAALMCRRPQPRALIVAAAQMSTKAT